MGSPNVKNASFVRDSIVKCVNIQLNSIASALVTNPITMIVALGNIRAGLFSNNKDVSKAIFDAGEITGEKVWEMPMDDDYDQLIKTEIADMKNIGGPGAGSITAACFLKRHVEKTPWAHLDIAGMAFSKYGGALNSGGATGYGVRLLNKLIEDDYE